jgi:SET domain-containing protein
MTSHGTSWVVSPEKTTEFSFILKPAQHGIGVFATHDIAQGTPLRLFGDGLPEDEARVIAKEEVPPFLHGHCIREGDTLFCAKDFGKMSVGWYMNHSKSPNAVHRNYEYYALRDIKEGEEILIDYNSLEEPIGDRESYYG